MIQNEFYLTLPSNSSMQYFPQNKTTHFITQLPQQIKLIGEWEVALSEIIYPCSFYNVNKYENIVTIMYETKNALNVENIPIEPKNYENIDLLLHAFNENSKTNSFMALAYDKTVQKISAKFKNAKIHHINCSPSLTLQMGFPPLSDIYLKKNSVNKPNLSLGIPTELYLYCDIIEPQLVGDTVSPLLRIIPVDIKNYVLGATKVFTYSTPHYVPVLKREFQNIEIDIRCNSGYSAPFQFGTLCVKLHFKRRSS